MYTFLLFFFFFNDTATTEIYTLSLHDALPISVAARVFKLHDAGQRDAAALIARRELVERLQPTLARVNREIYRQTRELSVQRAVSQMQAIVEAKRRVLCATVLVALGAGLLAPKLHRRP